MLRSQECTVFWYIVSPLTSTLWFWEVEMRGVNHQPIDDDSMGILKGYPSIHGYLVAKQDFNNFVWGHNYSVKKRIPVAYPLIFQLTRYLEPGVDRYLIYKFQIHKELEDQGYYTNQPGIFGSFFGAKNLSFLIEAEHHHVENLKPHLLRLHCSCEGLEYWGLLSSWESPATNPKNKGRYQKKIQDHG